MIKIFLAAAYHRKEEMVHIAEEIGDLGIGATVNARWIQPQEYSYMTMALADMEDARACDLFVRFSDFDHRLIVDEDTVPKKLATGSRMVEMGIALARGIPVVVVGGRQSLYDHLPSVTHLFDVISLKNWLTANFHKR